MAQYLKEEVRLRIEGAALRTIVARGYAGANMAEIARAAGLSTGNLYRYFPDKESLFQAVVPASIGATLTRLVKARLHAAQSEPDPRQAEPQSPFVLHASELLGFCIEHRLQVVILLGRDTGTPYEGFSQKTLRTLEDAAQEALQARAPERAKQPATAFALRLVYRGLLHAMVESLARFETGSDIRAAVETYERYHLAGLLALFS